MRSTGAPSMYMKPYVHLGIEACVYSLIVTHYRFGEGVIFRHGSQFDTIYSNFSRVFGVTALKPAV